ncbi:MAG: hypothetical protein U9Q20_06885 [Campylobacterota bacterium]|nr:hypothetical protein [Campylobacterota bacterium]
MKKNNQLILKEGYFKIAVAFAIAIFLNIFFCSFLGTIGFIVTLILIYIYRNPNRHLYRNSDSILSPIDGKIEAIDFHNGKQKIYIKTSLCDSSKVISPLDGNLIIKKQQHGLNLNPNCYKAKLLNEQVSLKINDLKIKFISGKCNNKIDFKKSNNLEQGSDIGIFLDGMVIVTYKVTKKLHFKIGDKVKRGEVLFNI